MKSSHSTDSIRKILFNEVSFVLAIVGVVSSAIFWVTGPQTDLALQLQSVRDQIKSDQELLSKIQNIKDNDLHTIEGKVNELDTRFQTQQAALIRIETILDERLPNKK